MTVQAKVHRDTPRRLTADRKQKQPTQMLVRQGWFSMNVENIDINVEVLSPNAKKVLTAKLAKDVAEQFTAQNVCPVTPRAQPRMAQPPIVHPVVCPVVCPVAPRAQPHMAQPPIVCPVVCHVVTYSNTQGTTLHGTASHWYCLKTSLNSQREKGPNS